MKFEEAFARVIDHEGGYVNDPRDRGGETKFGISKRAYPQEDIAALTLERAREIYRRDYWGPAGCHVVPPAISFDLFDMAVHSGVLAAVRALQSALGVTIDGVLGPRTLQAAQSMPVLRLVARLNGARLLYMTQAPTWPSHGRGWARRVAANLLEA